MGTHEGSGRALECGGAGAVVKTRGYFGTWPEEEQRRGKIQDRHHFVRRQRRTEVLEGAGGGGWDPPPCYARPMVRWSGGQVEGVQEARSRPRTIKTTPAKIATDPNSGVRGSRSCASCAA